MTEPIGLKIDDRVTNPTLMGDNIVGKVQRLAWAHDGELRYVFVDWGEVIGRKWEIPKLLRHAKETV